MDSTDTDIAILGGGCAGLSVAVRLAAAARSIRIIEPRKTYTDDRAWSFWRTGPDPFEDCVRASWTKWDVTGPGGLVQRGSDTLRCVFRGHPATDSESIRPPIPILSGHRFRSIRPPL